MLYPCLSIVIHELAQGASAEAGSVVVATTLGSAAFAFAVDPAELEQLAEVAEMLLGGQPPTPAMIERTLSGGTEATDALKGIVSLLVRSSDAWASILQGGVRLVYVSPSESGKMEVSTQRPEPVCEKPPAAAIPVRFRTSCHPADLSVAPKNASGHRLVVRPRDLARPLSEAPSQPISPLLSEVQNGVQSGIHGESTGHTTH